MVNHDLPLEALLTVRVLRQARRPNANHFLPLLTATPNNFTPLPYQSSSKHLITRSGNPWKFLQSCHLPVKAGVVVAAGFDFAAGD
jgi:hypothetical protein